MSNGNKVPSKGTTTKSNTPKVTKKGDKNIRELKIADIITDGDTQPRTETNKEVVAEYAEAIKAGTEFPQVIVYSDGETYWLVDGYHRLEAVKKLKRETIDCDIREGTLEEAQWYSYKVNTKHGLRRTPDDKRKAVAAALRHPNGVDLSNRRIAKHVGVDHKTVARVRDELVSTGEIPQSPVRKGLDDRRTNTTKKSTGKRKKKDDENDEDDNDWKPRGERDDDDGEQEDEQGDGYESEPECVDEDDDEQGDEYEYPDEEEDEPVADEDVADEDEDDEDEDDEDDLEKTEKFDVSNKSRVLKARLHKYLEDWPEKYHPKAVSVIRQVIEKKFNLTL